MLGFNKLDWIGSTLCGCFSLSNRSTVSSLVNSFREWIPDESSRVER